MQISENIMDVAKCLAERYPGGWDNIRSLHIHLQDSTLIPVYISLSKWITLVQCIIITAFLILKYNLLIPDETQTNKLCGP
jgi:hypothetical protein